MKRLLVYVLSFNLLIGSFLPGGGWSELAKLPDLVRHFEAHAQKSKGQISFLTFLQMHYAAGSKHVGTEDHTALPSLQLQVTVALFVPTFFKLQLNAPKAQLLPGLKNYFWNNLYSFQFLALLLNPPKSPVRL
ncbi:hypothetical protein [Arundinibacter roseus]|uniref:Uncharacterized protein n=1 Tax=Arundinibacter roseus TaxID=2070510 RepID=A0A4R4K7T4_9BACT|nr:hypothetical protein [Arundinibacter roseus]TDB63704.1 hypothetical protein EZE20_15515 [Arundinibacter roseus]